MRQSKGLCEFRELGRGVECRRRSSIRVITIWITIWIWMTISDGDEDHVISVGGIAVMAQNGGNDFKGQSQTMGLDEVTAFVEFPSPMI